MRHSTFGNFIHGQFGIPEDGKQDIIEVVRNAARQSADGLDFEHLLQLTFIFGECLGAFFNHFFKDFILITQQRIKLEALKCIGRIEQNNG